MKTLIDYQHLAFDEITLSDHKGIKITLDAGKLFRSSTTPPLSTAIRALQLSSPKQVETYVDKLTEYFAHHQISKSISKCTQLLERDETREKRNKLLQQDTIYDPMWPKSCRKAMRQQTLWLQLVHKTHEDRKSGYVLKKDRPRSEKRTRNIPKTDTRRPEDRPNSFKKQSR